MTALEALILGIVQGLTEFLPVSSSGHLTLVQDLFGLTNLHQYILYDLVVHLGTLLAILVFFYKPMKIILFHDKKRLMQVAIAILPLFPLLLFLKPLKEIYNQPELLGYFFLFTSAILYLGIRLGKAEENCKDDNRSWLSGLGIGIAQALAIFPGVSRSGMTISFARMIGWKRYDAVLFSFLIAVPTMIGATIVELLSLSSSESISLPWTHYLIGFGSAFIFGYIALKTLLRLALNDRFSYFVWYCLILGIGCLIYYG